jgi:hypothetical protein
MKTGKRRRASGERVRQHVPILDDAKRRQGQWLVLANGDRARLDLTQNGWLLIIRSGERPGAERRIQLPGSLGTSRRTGVGWPGNLGLQELSRVDPDRYFRSVRHRLELTGSRSLW